MPYLNSKGLLALLVREKLLSARQRDFILVNGERQAQKLLRQFGRRHADAERLSPGFPDLIDIITSLGMQTPEPDAKPITEEMILRVIGRELGIPFITLDPLKLNIELVTKTIPRNFAIRHLLLPFALENGTLKVACYYPDNRGVLEDVERVTQLRVERHLSTKEDIRRILAEFFGFQRSISAAEVQFGASNAVDIGNLEQYVRLANTQELSASDQHIKAAVNHLFSYALEQRASDIHIEPKRDVCLVRYRIDGVLHTIHKLPKAVHAAITSRIKTLARLDIAEKRRPQDGRIKIGRGEEEEEGAEAEIRVSTVPVAFGEKTVMRILNPEVIFQDLGKLGFSRRDMAVYNGFMTAAHGLVFVTGPTGSGKSTTLYSTLKKIATPDKNIVTVEDPVEMVYEEFNQIAVQAQIDVTFSTILRNILRQDPDIIMIGEIRDLETATHAVQAALTGHLVFSTLHTNDAVSSILRLEDLGLEPFLVASTMLGALAQRLVRRICPHCGEAYTADGETLAKMGFPVAAKDRVKLTRGRGCPQCRGTGYLGRMGIFEVFPMSAQIKKLIAARANDSELRQVAVREGMTTLKEDAWRKVRAGLTTVEEALRVTGEA